MRKKIIYDEEHKWYIVKIKKNIFSRWKTLCSASNEHPIRYIYYDSAYRTANIITRKYLKTFKQLYHLVYENK